MSFAMFRAARRDCLAPKAGVPDRVNNVKPGLSQPVKLTR